MVVGAKEKLYFSFGQFEVGIKHFSVNAKTKGVIGRRDGEVRFYTYIPERPATAMAWDCTGIASATIVGGGPQDLASTSFGIRHFISRHP